MSGIVDTSTGEWFESARVMKKKKVDNRNKLCVGVDIPYPKDCIERDSLFKSVSELDNYLNKNTPIEVNHPYILDCVMQGFLNARKAEALTKLVKCVVAWNYGFTTKKHLLEVSCETPKNYARWVKDMEPYFKLLQTHQGVDHYKVTFNPIVVWRGANYMQDQAIKSYYGSSGIGDS